MTRIEVEEVVCGACGTQSRQPLLLSSNTFGGAPDLDGRPARMLRGTMHLWVTRCPTCGYCARELDAAPPADWPEIAGYRETLDAPDLPDLARTFMAYSLLAETRGDLEDAIDAAYGGAWTCDDKRSRAGAVRCRARAVELTRRLWPRSPSLGVVAVDALRVSGRFDEALAWAAEVEEHLRSSAAAAGGTAASESTPWPVRFAEALIARERTLISAGNTSPSSAAAVLLAGEDREARAVIGAADERDLAAIGRQREKLLRGESHRSVDRRIESARRLAAAQRQRLAEESRQRRLARAREIRSELARHGSAYAAFLDRYSEELLAGALLHHEALTPEQIADHLNAEYERRCPRCGFSYQWDSVRRCCGHCGGREAVNESEPR